MGDVLPFRPVEQPPQRGPEGFQPSGARVSVVVRLDTLFADLILAGSELAFAWSEALLGHAVSVRGSHRHNPMGERCKQTAMRPPENFGDRT